MKKSELIKILKQKLNCNTRILKDFRKNHPNDTEMNSRLAGEISAQEEIIKILTDDNYYKFCKELYIKEGK